MSTVVVASSWSTALPSSTAKLKAKVAKLYGLDGDSDAEQISLDALDDSVKEINTGLHDFMLISQTGITLTENEDEYVLASNFFKEKLAFLVDSDGNQRDPLSYLDLSVYRRLWGDTVRAGAQPAVYSALNTHADGKIYIAPKPDASIATEFTLTVVYHRRIPLPSAVGTLDIPQEVESAILYGAYKRMALSIQGAAHPDVTRYELLQDKWIDKMQGQDRRHPDELTRFRMVDRRDRVGRLRGVGPLFIKIN